MSEKTYQINRDTVPNRAKDYYENNKRLREQARVKHRNLYLEDKNKRQNIMEINITICQKKGNKN